MNTKPNIKKPWLKPFVKVVSVKKDTYRDTFKNYDGKEFENLRSRFDP